MVLDVCPPNGETDRSFCETTDVQDSFILSNLDRSKRYSARALRDGDFLNGGGHVRCFKVGSRGGWFLVVPLVGLCVRIMRPSKM
jgi:hypothetical protein